MEGKRLIVEVKVESHTGQVVLLEKFVKLSYSRGREAYDVSADKVIEFPNKKKARLRLMCMVEEVVE